MDKQNQDSAAAPATTPPATEPASNPAPTATQPGQDVVAPPPAEDGPAPVETKPDEKKAPKPKAIKSKSPGSGITGTIVGTIIVLAALCGLAVMAYLNS